MASCLKPTIAGGRGLDVVTDPGGAPICRFTSLLGYCGRGGVELNAKSRVENGKVGSPMWF